MKKWITVLLTVCMLAGCSASSDQSLEVEKYESYYAVVEENVEFAESSSYFSISAEMSSLPDGTYRYYIFIDEPRTAMYDITAIAIDQNSIDESGTKMMPSIGIFEGKYCMIPDQVNSDAGYVKGLMLSGETDLPEAQLYILVEWQDVNRVKLTREFIHLSVSASDSTD